MSAKQTKGSKYAKDNSDSVMMRVQMQKKKLMADPNEDDFVETSPEMVNFFAADPKYSLNYVIVSGIKVFKEGTVEKTLKQESKSTTELNGTF